MELAPPTMPAIATDVISDRSTTTRLLPSLSLRQDCQPVRSRPQRCQKIAGTMVSLLSTAVAPSATPTKTWEKLSAAAGLLCDQEDDSWARDVVARRLTRKPPPEANQ